MSEAPKEGRTFVEEIEVAGNELVDRVKELVQEGNVRRLILRKENGDMLLEVPLTAGVAVGGAVVLFTPLLAALGAMAALLARVKVEVVRVEFPPESTEIEEVEEEAEE